MSYRYETRYTSPHQSERSAFGHRGKPTGITIHHWGNDGQTHQGVVNYLCSSRPNNPTSAHYVVSDGLVTCIVDPDRAAFHAASYNGQANGSTIGIECRPEMSAGDWRTVVELCVELEKVYGSLRYWTHANWGGTACPGRWASKINKLIEDVNAASKAPASRPQGRRHTVRSGDTLWGLAKKYGTTAANLAALNPGARIDALRIGQVLRIDG